MDLQRHPDRRAVPDARRVARRQRARAAGPQLRPLDDRGRRDVPVRAAHPRDLRAGPRARRPRSPRRPWSTCSGPGRDATGPAPGRGRRRSRDPAVHLHLYDKREVFERRKMGHLTALGATDGPGARDGRPSACQARTGPTKPRRRRTTDERGHDARSPGRRHRRRQPLGLPDARGRRRRPRRARCAVGAQGRVGAPDAGSPVPLRRGGRRAAGSG